MMPKESNLKLSLMAFRRQYKDPYALYDYARSQGSFYFDPSSQCWLVTGHAAIKSVLNNACFSSELVAHTSRIMPSVAKQIVFLDGEAHHRAQQVMLHSLAQIARKMPEQVRNFVLEVIKRDGPEKEIDLVRDIAAPISLLSIAYILGIPLDDRKKLLQLEQWSDTFGDITSGYFHTGIQDIVYLEQYFRQLIEERRRVPGDDLLTALIAAEDIFPTDEDLIANCMMIFAAGRFTTKKVIGNGLPLLLSQWNEFQRAYQDKPNTFVRNLTEELLRMVTPTRYVIRHATDNLDLVLANQERYYIRRGENVLLFLEAANYDPALFACPMQFDPQRRPNKHIAFGYGTHQCLGATIARMEIQITLDVLFSSIQFKTNPNVHPEWNTNPNLGGFSSFPVLMKAE